MCLDFPDKITEKGELKNGEIEKASVAILFDLFIFKNELMSFIAS